MVKRFYRTRITLREDKHGKKTYKKGTYTEWGHAWSGDIFGMGTHKAGTYMGGGEFIR